MSLNAELTKIVLVFCPALMKNAKIFAKSEDHVSKT